MVEIEKLKRLIDQSDLVDFADFGNGVSLVWINKAEDYLGFSLPDSYKWWLLNYVDLISLVSFIGFSS